MKKILFAEDQHNIRAYLKNFEKDFKCFFAFTPPEAWRILAKQKGEIDLVCSDIYMPGDQPSGMDFVREIKKDMPWIKTIVHSDCETYLKILREEGFICVSKNNGGYHELRKEILKLFKDDLL